jgi:hypothetical protein
MKHAVGKIPCLITYTLYVHSTCHQCNKDKAELHETAEDLEATVIKIGRFLGSSGAGSNLRAACVLWQLYIAQFDNQEQFSGMAKRTENINFLNYLDPMIDIWKRFPRYQMFCNHMLHLHKNPTNL